MKIEIVEHTKTLETEARRLLFLYNQLHSGFYGNKRFILLPNSTHSHTIVNFPELDYSPMKKFHKQLNEKPFTGEDDRRMVDQMMKIMIEGGVDVEEKVLQIGDIKEIIKRLNKEMEQLFVDLPDKFRIRVFETEYGTTASFGRLEEADNGWVEMRVFIRSDQSYKAIVPLILMSVIAHNKYRDDKNNRYWQDDWEVNQSTLDYFMEYTVFSELYPEYKSFLSKLEEQLENGAGVLESMQFYARLGYPINSVLTLKANKLYYADIELNTLLTPTERRMVRHFVRNRGKVCSFEELSEVIWKDEATEKYSLWAIAKSIQKIREKLDQLGAPRNLIQTKRKEGYILFD